jgi:hypothetical protein
MATGAYDGGDSRVGRQAAAERGLIVASLRRFFLRLFNACRPWHAEPDPDRELTSHLRLLEDDYQRRGLSPQGAKDAAKRAFGSIERPKDRYRDAGSRVDR